MAYAATALVWTAPANPPAVAQPPAPEERHWAYRIPVKTTPPQPQHSARPLAPIDAFISARLRTAGLELLPDEEPARLLRRLYLDLIGLPPPLDAVDAFVADPTFERYATTVDGLLASPRFGEKWAIGWLDLARYADSDGYQRDGFRNVWPFRDWVIRAFNDDMPFDRFTIEQLAGDLLPSPTREQLIATGFHRGPILNLEAGTDAEEDRVKQVVDRVNTTGTVWLAASLECAQCHDHKYDPISIREYYSLFAFFNQTPQEGRRIPGGNDATMEYVGPDIEVDPTADELRRRRVAQQRVHAAEQQFITKVDELCDALPQERLAAIAASQPAAAQLIGSAERGYKEAVEIRKAVFPGAADAAAKQLAKLEKQVAARRKELASGEFQIGFGSRVMREIDEPRDTFVLKRGDFLNPGEPVEPATPAALHRLPAGAPRNRLGLAQWLVADDNPLTARVAINRLWAELFGRGIVTTLEDFGTQGAAPSHPELLDWLAVTFREDDAWSMKRAIRRMVLSRTYRQAAAVDRSRRDADPANALFSRGPGGRLPAELIRDNALAISGLLSDKMFGPPVRPLQPEKFWRVIGQVDNTYYLSSGEDLYRRGIYTIWRRSAHYPSFATFDAPNRGACTVQRESSNTPLQALTLMNDPAYVEMARAFASRVLSEAADDPPRAQLSHAFRLALARQPREAELDVLDRLLTAGGGAAEGWFDVATALLNLHATINR